MKSLVEVHIVVAPGEDHIGHVIARKEDAHNSMKAEMILAMRRAIGRAATLKTSYQPKHIGRLPRWMNVAPDSIGRSVPVGADGHGVLR